MRFMAGCVFSTLLASTLATGAHATEYLADGSFEKEGLAAWTAVNTSSLTSVVTSDDGMGYGPEDGQHFLLTGEGVVATLSQSFKDVAGETLIVSGYVAENAASADPANGTTSLSVSIAGVDYNVVYSASDLTDTGYMKFSFTVTATGDDTFSIAFEDTYDYFAIDNLSVTEAVPEPASVALLATSLFGLGLIRRRRNA